MGLSAARHLALADEGRRFSRRPAIRADEDSVSVARNRAVAAQAVRSDHPQDRAWRTLLALRPGRTRWTGRARRTDGARFAFRTLRSRRTGIALGARTAAGKAGGHRDQKYPVCGTHVLRGGWEGACIVNAKPCRSFQAAAACTRQALRFRDHGTRPPACRRRNLRTSARATSDRR